MDRAGVQQTVSQRSTTLFWPVSSLEFGAAPRARGLISALPGVRPSRRRAPCLSAKGRG